MVRLKDIAQHVGVSVMTVSKALRDAPDIAASTKTKIKLVAQQMGYVPDASARGLRSRRTRLIGLVIPNIANPVFARMVMAIEDRAHEAGYEVILVQSQNIPEREDSCILRLMSRRVDGLTIFPVCRLSPTVRVFQEIQASHLPTVVLGTAPVYCSHFPNVQGEEREGSCRVTQHLLELGHRRIAFLAGPPLAIWAQARLDGYRHALREAGLEPDDRLIFPAGATVEDGMKAGLHLLNEDTQATAIQAVNDTVAIGCGEALLGQGLHIPRDLSLTGYGNILAAEHFRVPLTTVRQPKQRLGAAAVDMLLQLLAGRQPASQRLPASLVLRASTAPPPKLTPAPAATPV